MMILKATVTMTLLSLVLTFWLFAALPMGSDGGPEKR